MTALTWIGDPSAAFAMAQHAAAWAAGAAAAGGGALASAGAAAAPAADPLAVETLVALAAFAFAGSWTPGPNNAMLAASGARFGYRATVPHLLGVTIGFSVMCFAIGLGLGEAFQRSEILREALRWAGAAAMLFIAWKIATAPPPGAGRARGRPLSFLEAAGFQWINPKAWMMCLGVLAQFASGAAPVQEAGAAAAVFLVSGLSSTHAWTLFGKAAGRWLGEGWRLRAFNLGMAGLVAMGIFALMTEDLG